MLRSNKSLIFSFYLDISNSSKIILSRVKNDDFAISDCSLENKGFGFGDLYIFYQSCKLFNYSVKIHDSETFETDDYEVFQVLEKQ